MLIEGYASLFGTRDGQGDMVMPGAFADCLRRKGPDSIGMLFQHNPAEPIGTWLEMRETARGLHVLGRLDTRVQRGRELLARLEDGAINGLSIGFHTVQARADHATRSRQLLAIELWEISLVTFPMLEGARVRAINHSAPQPSPKRE